jgi:hypothetical protein
LSGQLVEALAAAEQPEEDRSSGGVACTRLHMRERHRSEQCRDPEPREPNTQCSLTPRATFTVSPVTEGYSDGCKRARVSQTMIGTVPPSALHAAPVT